MVWGACIGRFGLGWYDVFVGCVTSVLACDHWSGAVVASPVVSARGIMGIVVMPVFVAGVVVTGVVVTGSGGPT